MRAAEEILSFWFGPVDDEGRSSPEHAQRWFRVDPAFDDEVRARFLGDHEAVLRGLRDHWLATARGRLAYVIVLDQLSRNLFRDTPAMFASDDRALDAALGGIARGMDRKVRGDARNFYYMPLMHSELLAIQDRCVELFAALCDEQPTSQFAKLSLDFARRHRDIVARFGRFPHRNATLGRPSTPEEEEFLTQPGSSF